MKHQDFKKALIIKAMEIARDPLQRGNLVWTRRSLTQVVEKHKPNQLRRDHAPEWYIELVILKEDLVKILSQPIENIYSYIEYRGVQDLVLIAKGATPKHLSEWENEWESVVVPNIIELARKVPS